MLAVVEPDELLTSPEVCRLAGVTYRQLDYWTRAGVVTPTREASGTGSVRGWSIEDAALVAVCGSLSKLNAEQALMRKVVEALRVFPELWSGKVLITPDGRIRPSGITSSGMDGLLVDLASCRAYVGAEPVPWPAAV